MLQAIFARIVIWASLVGDLVTIYPVYGWDQFIPGHTWGSHKLDFEVKLSWNVQRVCLHLTRVWKLLDLLTPCLCKAHCKWKLRALTMACQITTISFTWTSHFSQVNKQIDTRTWCHGEEKLYISFSAQQASRVWMFSLSTKVFL